MPIVGTLTSRVQARYLIAFGWLCLAVAMLYATTQLSLLIDFGTAARIRVVQVVGLGFLFVPITLAAYVGIPPEKSNVVAGLVNFMRNIGSSVGTSMVTTIIGRRSQYHQMVLIGNTTSGNPTFLNTVDSLTNRLAQSGLNSSDAQREAHARLYSAAQNQSTTLAYIDTFWILAVTSAIMFVLSFALKKNVPGQGGEGAAA